MKARTPAVLLHRSGAGWRTGARRLGRSRTGRRVARSSARLSAMSAFVRVALHSGGMLITGRGTRSGIAIGRRIFSALVPGRYLGRRRQCTQANSYCREGQFGFVHDVLLDEGPFAKRTHLSSARSLIELNGG